MNVQHVIDETRLTHIRELQTAITRLKADNAVLRDANAQLNAHLDLAILAARDLDGLAEGAKLIIVDGWNMILGAKKEAKDREDLEARAREYLKEHPDDFVWIVLDGPRFAAHCDGHLRISYTGGSGEHRADKFVCDFLRMARLRGTLEKIEVRTNDKDFIRDVERLRR